MPDPADLNHASVKVSAGPRLRIAMILAIVADIVQIAGFSLRPRGPALSLPTIILDLCCRRSAHLAPRLALGVPALLRRQVDPRRRVRPPLDPRRSQRLPQIPRASFRPRRACSSATLTHLLWSHKLRLRTAQEKDKEIQVAEIPHILLVGAIVLWLACWSGSDPLGHVDGTFVPIFEGVFFALAIALMLMMPFRNEGRIRKS